MTRDPRDYKVEISGLAEAGARSPSSSSAPASPRAFLSVHFACCGVYRRIYRAKDGKSYSGNCPRCGKPVRFTIAPGGTDCRFFRVE
jgi:hypothetical protein